MLRAWSANHEVDCVVQHLVDEETSSNTSARQTYRCSLAKWPKGRTPALSEPALPHPTDPAKPGKPLENLDTAGDPLHYTRAIPFGGLLEDEAPARSVELALAWVVGPGLAHRLSRRDRDQTQFTITTTDPSGQKGFVATQKGRGDISSV